MLLFSSFNSFTGNGLHLFKWGLWGYFSYMNMYNDSDKQNTIILETEGLPLGMP